MDQYVIEYLHNGILPGNKNKSTLDTRNAMDES